VQAQPNVESRSLQDLIARNHELMNQLSFLSEKIKACMARRQIDTVKATQIIRHLNSLEKRSSQRRTFYYDLKHVQAALLPTVLHRKKMKRSCDRIATENAWMQEDENFCNALQQCVARPTNFVDHKKVFFKKGRSKIPKKVWPKAKVFYRSILDSIISRAEQHPAQDFTATIFTHGFADGTDKRNNRRFYTYMKRKLKSADLSNDEINTYLANARAYSLYSVLFDIYKEKRKRIRSLNNLTIEWRQVGKGSQLPNPRFKYREDDKRRRSARVKWYILPNF
jgi:hypothetical protein